MASVDIVKQTILKYRDKIKDNYIFFAGYIPTEKLQRSQESFGPSGVTEVPLILIDDGTTAAKKEGAIFTAQGIYIKSAGEKPQFLAWADIKSANFSPGFASKWLIINDSKFLRVEFPSESSMFVLTEMIHEIIALKHGALIYTGWKSKDLITRFNNLKDNELIEILNTDPSKYTPEAISIGQTELNKRGGLELVKARTKEGPKKKKEKVVIQPQPVEPDNGLCRSCHSNKGEDHQIIFVDSNVASTPGNRVIVSTTRKFTRNIRMCSSCISTARLNRIRLFAVLGGSSLLIGMVLCVWYGLGIWTSPNLVVLCILSFVGLGGFLFLYVYGYWSDSDLSLTINYLGNAIGKRQGADWKKQNRCEVCGDIPQQAVWFNPKLALSHVSSESKPYVSGYRCANHLYKISLQETLSSGYTLNAFDEEDDL